MRCGSNKFWLIEEFSLAHATHASYVSHMPHLTVANSTENSSPAETNQPELVREPPSGDDAFASLGTSATNGMQVVPESTAGDDAFASLANDVQVRPKPSEDFATSARVAIIREVQAVPEPDSGWRLCLQWCRYNYSDGDCELGYRFIWRKPTGNLQAARGQARLPSRRHVDFLFNRAAAEGWGEETDGSGWVIP